MNTSNIDITLHSAEKKYSSNTGEYWYFNADVITDISIKGMSLTAVLQPGQWHYHNNYSTPAYEIDYSDEGGTHPFIYKIWQFTESDLEDLDDEDLNELNDLIKADLSREELVEFYLRLCELRIDAQQAFDDAIENDGDDLKELYEESQRQEKEYYELMDFDNAHLD